MTDTNQQTIDIDSLDIFTRAYIEAALWSTTDGSDESGGAPLDANYSIEDIAPKTLATIIADCARFQTERAEWLTEANVSTSYGVDAQAGHDFWLTRCGHGCGFWDGDWAEPAATKLTDASNAFGNVDLYVGDDGLIYS